MPKWSWTSYLNIKIIFLSKRKFSWTSKKRLFLTQFQSTCCTDIYTDTDFLLFLLKVSYILQGTGQHEDFMGHKGKLKTGDVQVIYTYTCSDKHLLQINGIHREKISQSNICFQIRSLFRYVLKIGSILQESCDYSQWKCHLMID